VDAQDQGNDPSMLHDGQLFVLVLLSAFDYGSGGLMQTATRLDSCVEISKSDSSEIPTALSGLSSPTCSFH